MCSNFPVTAMHWTVGEHYEDDDLPHLARPIAINEEQAHNACDDGFDWFTFEATAGRTDYLRAMLPPAQPGEPLTSAGSIQV